MSPPSSHSVKSSGIITKLANGDVTGNRLFFAYVKASDAFDQAVGGKPVHTQAEMDDLDGEMCGSQVVIWPPQSEENQTDRYRITLETYIGGYPDVPLERSVGYLEMRTILTSIIAEGFPCYDENQHYL